MERADRLIGGRGCCFSAEVCCEFLDCFLGVQPACAFGGFELFDERGDGEEGEGEVPGGGDPEFGWVPAEEDAEHGVGEGEAREEGDGHDGDHDGGELAVEAACEGDVASADGAGECAVVDGAVRCDLEGGVGAASEAREFAFLREAVECVYG